MGLYNIWIATSHNPEVVRFKSHPRNVFAEYAPSDGGRRRRISKKPTFFCDLWKNVEKNTGISIGIFAFFWVERIDFFAEICYTVLVYEC